MNKLLTCLAIFCGLTLALLAQEKPGDGKGRPSANAVARPAGTNGVVKITSRSLEYDSATGKAVYEENVHVDDPEMTIDCEVMTVQFAQTGKKAAAPGATNVPAATQTPTASGAPAAGGLSPMAGSKVDTIVAERKVVIVNKKDGSKATGTKAVYTAATDVVELTGDPVLETEQGKLFAELVILDRAKNKLHATGNVRMELRSEAMKRGKTATPKADLTKPQP